MNRKRINEAIRQIESFPLSEDAQSLVNYLRANIDDIEEAMGD